MFRLLFVNRPLALVFAALATVLIAATTLGGGERVHAQIPPPKLRCVDLALFIDAQGEACISLEPRTVSNTGGADHAVTATVSTDDGPLEGIPVIVLVIDGPNAGELEVNVTDAAGQVVLSYKGDGGAGTDKLGTEACVTPGCSVGGGFVDTCLADPEACVATFFEDPTCGGGDPDQYLCDYATADWVEASTTTVPTPTIVTETPGDVVDAEADGDDSDFPWWLIILIIVIVIALLLLLFALARRRRGDQED